MKRRVPVPLRRVDACDDEFIPPNPSDLIYQEYLEVENGSDRVYPPVKIILTEIVEGTMLILVLNVTELHYDSTDEIKFCVKKFLQMWDNEDKL